MSQLWMTYESLSIFRVDGSAAYHYTTDHVALDADGSPRAYGPNDSGLDANANAGFPGRGWRSVLVADPTHPDQPFVGPNGFFVSKTSLQDERVAATDPARYVDAETVPYIVFPGAFYAISGTGRMGDLVMARHLASDRQGAAIVADGGPFKAPLGEISLRLAADLGGVKPNPRTGRGAPRGPIQYVVFPGSKAAPPWRRDLVDIEASARRYLEMVGGWPRSE